VEFRLIVGPDFFNCLKRLVKALPSGSGIYAMIPRVLDHPSRSHAEDQSPAGQQVQRRYLLGCVNDIASKVNGVSRLAGTWECSPEKSESKERSSTATARSAGLIVHP
jgi:hypothetical protein